MAITIVLIDPNDPISSGPSTINSNLTTIKSHIDDIEALLSTSTNSLKLTNLATIPANSIESATQTLTGGSGTLFSISPNGGASVMTIDFEGNVVANNITANGDTTVEDITINGTATMGDVEISGAIDLTGAGAIVKNKTTVFTIVDTNTGNTAANPIDISTGQILLLDYNNGGTGLANSGEVKLDLTNVQEGQIFEFYCTRINSGGTQALFNGVTGAPIFAHINPSGTGISDISDTVKPSFVPAASPNTLSYLKVIYTDIGGGNFRLLVLDSKNVNGVG